MNINNLRKEMRDFQRGWFGLFFMKNSVSTPCSISIFMISIGFQLPSLHAHKQFVNHLSVFCSHSLLFIHDTLNMNNNGSNNEFRNNIIILQLKYCWEKMAMKENPQTKTPFILSLSLSIKYNAWNMELYNCDAHVSVLLLFCTHITSGITIFLPLLSKLLCFICFTDSIVLNVFIERRRRKKEAKKIVKTFCVELS